jgi:hypothetical protein
MTYRRFEMFDPERVLINKEARTCKGCQNRVILWGLEYCGKGKSKPGVLNMRRCKDGYEPSKGAE